MKVYVFGAETYKSFGGKLIEIKIIAEDKKTAVEMMRDICKNSKCINEDEGFFLNDEWDYETK